MKIPLPSKLRAFVKSVKRTSSSIDEEETKQPEEENETLKIQHEKQLEKIEEKKIQHEQFLKQLKAAEELIVPPIYVNIIDENGEVLQLKTTKNEGTSRIFDTYADHQGTQFLLSRIMYEFRFNGNMVPVGATFDSFGIDNNAIIYVTTKVPSRSYFYNRMYPNIPVYVTNHPRCFIDDQIQVKIDGRYIISAVADYLDKGTGLFIIVTSRDGDKLQQCGTDEFIKIIQNYYSDINGYTIDMVVSMQRLVSKYEDQVESLDTDQSLDEPNAIMLRIIKIKLQIHRLLNYINKCNKQEGKRVDLFSYYTKKLGKVLSSLSDKMKRHKSNPSIHKVNKPLFESEEVVRAKRWLNNDRALEYSWERGTIISYEEYEDIDGYGPCRVYSVKFDDGECHSDIEDYHVIPDENYTNKSWDSIGISRVYDNDSLDPWAREVGWYTVELDGVEEPFVYLTNAIRAVNLNAAPGQQNPRKMIYQTEHGMLQSIDRLSDPIMRRIGRILIQLEDSISGVKSGFIWKMAYGQWNDRHTTQMRDSVYNFALLQQSKTFGSVSTLLLFAVSMYHYLTHSLLLFIVRINQYRPSLPLLY